VPSRLKKKKGKAVRGWVMKEKRNCGRKTVQNRDITKFKNVRSTSVEKQLTRGKKGGSKGPFT